MSCASPVSFGHLTVVILERIKPINSLNHKNMPVQEKLQGIIYELIREQSVNIDNTKNMQNVQKAFNVIVIFLINCISIQCVEESVYLSKYVDVKPFRSTIGISFEDCKIECLSSSRCVSENYSKRLTACQLIGDGVESAITSIKAGWMYSLRPAWKQDLYDQCDCKDTEICEIAHDKASCKVVQCGDPGLPYAKLEYIGNINTIGAKILVGCLLYPGYNQGYRMMCSSIGKWTWLTSQLVCDDGIEVFRGRTSKGVIYQAFVRGYDTADSNEACLEVPTLESCTKHYRNNIIDQWETLHVSRVLFSVVKDGEEVKYVLFNGVNSTVKDWFSMDRIISSSWIDLPSTGPTTVILRGSIGSYVLSGEKCNLKRRFVMMRGDAVIGNCSTDAGWFVATSGVKGTCCIYDNIDGGTKLHYSKLNTSVALSSDDIGYADYFRVVVYADNWPVPSH